MRMETFHFLPKYDADQWDSFKTTHNKKTIYNKELIKVFPNVGIAFHLFLIWSILNYERKRAVCTLSLIKNKL